MAPVRIAAFAAALLATFCPGGIAQTASASVLGNKEPWRTETAIGDLVADAVRAAARADIALVTASELKVQDPPLPAGQVSASSIAALICYSDDPLARLSLTGAQVRQALEKSVGSYPSKNQAYLQVSGVQFRFDPARPTGNRVQSVTIGGQPLDTSRSYTVATTASLANGALGYWKVWSKDNIAQRYPDLSAVKAVRAFLERTAKIDYSKLDRITPGGSQK